ncbi:VWA domain-containing protein [Streptomyces sp. NPDC021093]|uniref:VWA domain-containing protein n=1 Tax=Streptomyces sp. NPDC021093 TaxID=3365112 RepID=UPI0037B437CC
MDDLPVQILVLPERPLARSDVVTEFDVVIEVRCRSDENIDRSDGAMNLCLVIDRSASMDSADKLETAKRSCVDIFRRIKGDDLFTVVTFDDMAQVAVNPQTPKNQVEERIRAIQSGGMTNLSLGWYQGLLELQSHMTAGHYGRLILLSDGQANAGETKKTALAAVASRARDEGITTSTIGIGADFQEDLLEAIATASGGRFWYISDSGIDNILEEEFRSALTIVLDRPRVELSLPAGVTINKELASLQKVNRCYSLRPLRGQDTFSFALRLGIDPAQVDGSEFTIGATLYEGTREMVSTVETVALASRAEVVTSPVHALVNSVVSRYLAERTKEKMLAGMASGDLAGMKEMLQAEIARMLRTEAQVLAMGNSLDATRMGDELGDIQKHRRMDETSMLVYELVETYVQEPEVAGLLNDWRKSVMHEEARRGGGWLDVHKEDIEVETSLLVDAITVADLLARRLPEHRSDLEEKRERLSERLALFR